MTNETPMNSPEAIASVIPITLYTGGCDELARAYKTWAWSMAAAVISMTARCGHYRPVVGFEIDAVAVDELPCRGRAMALGDI